MKIGIESKITVVGKNARDYKKTDGQTGTSYSLAILQDGACTNVSCTEDLFEAVFPDLTTLVSVYGYYDDKYQRLMYEGVVSPVKTPATK